MNDRRRFQDLSEARAVLSDGEMLFERRRRTAGLALGPAAFVLLLLLPPAGLSIAAARLLAVVAWVLIWWVTEAVPIPVTALLGPAVAVLCGVGSARDLFAPFSNPIIFLFLGSFILAEGMFASGLDRRFAFAILSRRWVGSSATRILVAFAVITAFLSMWLSNTATTAMMYPIGISVLAALSALIENTTGRKVDLSQLRFGTSLMLATAYAASIGGIATPVGTPPNLIVLGLLDSLAGIQIPFFHWMLLTTPTMVVMLAGTLAYLRWALPPELATIEGSRSFILEQRRAMGRWTRAQRNVAAAFGTTVALWVAPGLIALLAGRDAPLYLAVSERLPEAVVAVVGAALLFILPVNWRERRFTLTWNQATRIDWGTLLLFGGGLSLGGAMFQTGLAEAVGHGLVEITGARSLAALTFLFGVTSVYLTETTSNTASATMICPLAIAAAQAAGVSPVPPAVAVALGTSMAFMLPVSTPPNAIVYGSGCVKITQMVRHGFVIDLMSSAMVPTATLVMLHLLGP